MAWLKKIVAHGDDMIPPQSSWQESDADAARAAKRRAEDALNNAKIRQTEITRLTEALAWVKQQNHIAEMLTTTFERRKT